MNTRLGKIYLIIIFLSFAHTIVSVGQASGLRTIQAVEYSPDGNFIAFAIGTLECNSANPQEFAVQIIDRTNNQLIQNVGDNTCNITDLAWSPDSTRIALSSADGSASVWDVISGSQIALFSGSGFGVRSLDNIAWSPNGEFLVVDRSIWNPQTGNRVGSSLTDDNLIAGPTYANAWSPDGQLLAFVTATEQVVMWDISSVNTEQWTLVKNFDIGLATEIDYSPDGQLIAVANTTEIRVFDTITGSVSQTFSNTNSNFTDVQWSPNGEYLVASSSAGTVHIWEFNTQIEVETLNFSTPVYAIDWSPDGQEIAIGRRLTSNDTFIDTVKAPDITPIPTPTTYRRRVISP